MAVTRTGGRAGRRGGGGVASPAVGVGVDVVAVERVADDLRRWGAAFLDRLLTDAEQARCHEQSNDHHDLSVHVAACLAAKEAVVKVLGGRPRGFTWRGVELVPDTEAGLRREGRALLSAVGQPDGGFIGQWRAALDDALAPAWAGGPIHAVAAPRQSTHLVAVAVGTVESAG